MRLLIGLFSVSLLQGCFTESTSVLATVNNIEIKEAGMFSLFNKKVTKTYVIASPLSGVLMKGGKPLANTKILRRLSWNANETGIVQGFTTDEKGFFSVPVHEETFAMGQLIEFVAKQKLYANEEKYENLFWYSPKRSEELYSETGGELEEMVCDLNSEDERVEISDFSAVLTRCTWKNMR